MSLDLIIGDQTLFYKRLSAVGDRGSGNHRLGAFTSGVNYMQGHHYLRAGYQIFNNDRTHYCVALRYGF